MLSETRMSIKKVNKVNSDFMLTFKHVQMNVKEILAYLRTFIHVSF